MNSTLHSESDSSSRQCCRVLVVDDEPSVLAVATTILRSHGFLVFGCESGEAALDYLASHRGTPEQAHVVVLDLTLPGGMSGFEVLEQIQYISPEIQVIACSGFFQEDARDLCQAIGFADILQKPYPLETLATTVRRCYTREKYQTGANQHT